MKSWFPVIIRPDRHPRLPHSPSTKPPWSREVRFNKVVTKLLGLSGPIKPDIQLIQLKACPRGPKRRGGYHLGTSEYSRPAPHPSLPSAPLSPICPTRSHHQAWTQISTHHIQHSLLVQKREGLLASGTYHSSSTDGYQLSISHLIA
jgi:hypothetical protein